MKILILLVACMLHVLLVVAQADSSNSIESTCFWHEEFVRDGKINLANWTYFKGVWPEELELYTDNLANIRVKRGVLNIKAVKSNEKGMRCTSGRIHTLHKVSFQYGRLDIKAKCPTGKGIWPAIWMLPVSFPQTPYGEIDILEYIECWKSKQYQGNVHIVTKDSNRKEKRTQYAKKVKANVSKYHVYSLEWFPDKLRFLVDGKLVHEYLKSSNPVWPFDQPYYLILNLAYGGWGGQCGLDDSIFPCTMKIDWIRYYKLKE